MRVALVHDYLNQMGGAEKVLLALHDLYPQAPIYTSIYDPSRVDRRFRSMDVRTSFMQRLPFVKSTTSRSSRCIPTPSSGSICAHMTSSSVIAAPLRRVS